MTSCRPCVAWGVRHCLRFCLHHFLNIDSRLGTETKRHFFQLLQKIFSRISKTNKFPIKMNCTEKLINFCLILLCTFVNLTKRSRKKISHWIVCLFMGFSSHSRIFHSYGDVTISTEGSNLDLYTALVAIEQWVFFLTVPHLMWRGPALYNGHLLRPVTLIPNAERLAVELSLPV